MSEIKLKSFIFLAVAVCAMAGAALGWGIADEHRPIAAFAFAFFGGGMCLLWFSSFVFCDSDGGCGDE